MDADPLALLPAPLLGRARECLSEVLGVVRQSVLDARQWAVVDSQDIERMRQCLDPTLKYSLVVHYNELVASETFVTALNQADPTIGVSTHAFCGITWLLEWGYILICL